MNSPARIALGLIVALGAPAAADPDGAIRVTVLNSVEQPAWSPDGSELVFEFDGDIYTVDPGSPAVALTSGLDFDYDPTYSPDGSTVVFMRNTDLWQVDLSTGVESALVSAPGDQQWPSFSPSGERLAFCTHDGSDWQLWVYDVASDSATPIVQLPGLDIEYPAWSPAGRYIAFNVRDSTGESDIGVYDFQNDVVHPLGDLAAHETYPSWSPSGAWILFESTRDAVVPFDSEIYRAQFFGDHIGPVEVLSCSDEPDSTPIWSPNGDLIAFTSQRGLLGGQFDLWVLPPAMVGVGDAATPPVAAQLQLAPSPFYETTTITLDAGALAASDEISIVNAAGRQVRTLRGAGRVQWDGRDQSGRAVPAGVYFVSAGGATTRVMRLR